MENKRLVIYTPQPIQDKISKTTYDGAITTIASAVCKHLGIQVDYKIMNTTIQQSVCSQYPQILYQGERIPKQSIIPFFRQLTTFTRVLDEPNECLQHANIMLYGILGRMHAATAYIMYSRRSWAVLSAIMSPFNYIAERRKINQLTNHFVHTYGIHNEHQAICIVNEMNCILSSQLKKCFLYGDKLTFVDIVAFAYLQEQQLLPGINIDENLKAYALRIKGLLIGKIDAAEMQIEQNQLHLLASRYCKHNRYYISHPELKEEEESKTPRKVIIGGLCLAFALFARFVIGSN